MLVAMDSAVTTTKCWRKSDIQNPHIEEEELS
jgi:hypothetical protein